MSLCWLLPFGMFMILFTMILNIINSVKCKDKENTWFSQNSVTGFVFYGSLVVMIFLVMGKSNRLATVLPVLIALIVIGLVIIMLKEMLGRIASRKKPAIQDGKVMYFVQAFFETFETALSFLSNTLSFVRIGAFAVSHVAMMEVVMMLAGGGERRKPQYDRGGHRQRLCSSHGGSDRSHSGSASGVL